MILVDENIDDQITKAIRAMAIEVYSIAEERRGIGDEQIVELSKEECYLEGCLPLSRNRCCNFSYFVQKDATEINWEPA